MPKRIGITAGEIDNRGDLWSPMTYGQSYTYSDAVINAGGAPFILPLTKNRDALRALYESLDGILVAGGNDVNPELYNQKAYEETNDFSLFRDEVEVQLLTWCLQDKKPILALCRGMQLVNVVCGGTLHQHIPKDIPDADDHQIKSQEITKDLIVHNLRLEPGSKLAQILESESIGANTHHHQAVNKIAPGFKAVAWAEDDVIEAIEPIDDKGFLVAVQCHPEAIENSTEKRWRKVFEAFVYAC